MKGSRVMSPQNTTVGVQDMPSQNMLLWCIDYFEPRLLKNSKCKDRLPLSFPYLPKDKFS